MAFDKDTQAKFDRMNLDENNVKTYEMPELPAIESAFEWYNEFRPYYLNEFKNYMYGAMPPRPDSMEFELLDCQDNALDGLAIRKIIRMHFKMRSSKAHFADMLLYIPKAMKSLAPTFVGLNFSSNAACSAEKDIPLSNIAPVKSESGYLDVYPAQDNERGSKTGRWPFKDILQRGYAVATCYYNDFFVDLPDGFKDSIYKLFYSQTELEDSKHGFGAIGAWAWGLSRMLDYLETDSLIDSGRVALVGHSRLGKTALWAGANDPRFAMVISNGSGCGGAKLSRRNFGENFEWLLHWRSYWFHEKLGEYIGREEELHIDQHILIALCAPRPVYVASGSEDYYADPSGEFTALREAGFAYRLFGSKGLDAESMPPINKPIHNDLGYHLHEGPHDINQFDWEKFMDFADLRLV